MYKVKLNIFTIEKRMIYKILVLQRKPKGHRPQTGEKRVFPQHDNQSMMEIL